MPRERTQTEKETITAIAEADVSKLVSFDLNGKVQRIRVFKLAHSDLKAILRRITDVWDQLEGLSKQLTDKAKAKVEINLANLIAEAPVLVDEFMSRAYCLAVEDFATWPGEVYLELLAEAVEYNITGNQKVMGFFARISGLTKTMAAQTGPSTKSSPSSSGGASE